MTRGHRRCGGASGDRRDAPCYHGDAGHSGDYSPSRSRRRARGQAHVVPCVTKNLALFQLTPDRCDPTSLGAPMPATTGPSHGRQSLSQLLALRSNARNGANALQWAIPLRFAGEKGGRGRLTGFQGVYGANSTLAQRALRKPVCAGTATAAVVAYFVNRGGPAADYGNRRKSSSGGQRF